jgi:hypothetical protein
MSVLRDFVALCADAEDAETLLIGPSLQKSSDSRCSGSSHCYARRIYLYAADAPIVVNLDILPY